MKFIVVGINHKTAPIAIREKFFLTPTEQDLLLSELKCNPAVLEAFVLSTCNRTEIYANTVDDPNYFSYFLQLLTSIKKIPSPKSDLQRFYTYTGPEAVRHFLTVAAGLDSLVLGENQILGQIKEAVEKARARGMFLRDFNILANMALRTGKKARAETDINYGGSSVSWAAIVMAEGLVGSFAEKSALIIGAGKMGETAIGQLRHKRLRTIYLMNRTQATAEETARKFGGTAVSFYDMKDILSEVDVCFCASGAPHYILEKATVETVMPRRQGRPLILVDISMPRNINPETAYVKNVHLFHIDDLNAVVHATMQRRQKAVQEVETIIAKKVGEYYDRCNKRTDPAILIAPHPGPK